MILFHGTEQIGVLFQKIKNAPEKRVQLRDTLKQGYF